MAEVCDSCEDIGLCCPSLAPCTCSETYMHWRAISKGVPVHFKCWCVCHKCDRAIYCYTTCNCNCTDKCPCECHNHRRHYESDSSVYSEEEEDEMSDNEQECGDDAGSSIASSYAMRSQEGDDAVQQHSTGLAENE
jgi:hypothetical protein